MNIKGLMRDQIEGFAFHTNRVFDSIHNRLHILPDAIENTAEAFKLISAFGAITSYSLTHSIASNSDLPPPEFQLLKDKIMV
jgi:hypothetical protein